MKYTINGILHGQEKRVAVDAASEMEAINKVQANYPDFEIKRGFSSNGNASTNRQTEIMEQILTSSQNTTRLVRYIWVLLLVAFIMRLAAEAFVLFVG